MYYKEISKSDAQYITHDDNDYSDITIGILTALPKEFAAVITLLNDVKLCNVSSKGKGIDVSGERYYTGLVESYDGSGIKRVVVALLPNMGNNFASCVSTKMQFLIPSIQNIIICGIAGGMPNEVHLGDIVVSTKGIVEYDFVTEMEDSFKLKEGVENCSSFLLEAVKYFDAFDMQNQFQELHNILLSNRQKCVRPKAKYEEFYGKNSKGQYVKIKRQVADKTNIFSGIIASGNAVQKNPKKRDYLNNVFDAKAVEMEASGVNHSTRLNGNGYLAIRGICDFCDLAKKDDWQDYAAGVAAAYTIALLKSIPNKSC